jgi:3-oxoacyl-[acyl-carrier protein] reductase
MNKKVLVTGSTKGIGLEIARKFSSSGWKVLATSRNPDNVLHFKSEFNKKENIDYFKVDFRSNDEINELRKTIVNLYENIDCLVINVGSGSGSVGVATDFEQNRQQIEDNFLTVYRTLKILGSTICKNKNSRIIIIGSVAGKVNVRAPFNYSSAKSAIVNLMKDYVRKLAQDGISVNLINPGHTLTPNGNWDKKLQEDPNGVQNILTKFVPLKRLGSGSDLAELVFLLTEYKSNYLNGAQIEIDGGLTISR